MHGFISHSSLETKGPVTLSRIPHGYRPRFHIWKLIRMRVDHVKNLRICHGSATDLLRISYGSPTEHHGDPRTGLPIDCFFNPQTLSVSIHSRSIADPVRSGNVLGDICWHGSITDQRDATRASRMGIRTIRTLTDELWKIYGYHVCMDFPEKSSMFDFSVMV